MSAVRERPVIFTGDSVRAILAGRKTQTRRIVREDAGNRGKPVGNHVRYWRPGEEDPTRWCGCDGLGSLGWVRCPYGVVGDLLWVRETWAARPLFIDGVRRSEICYAATPREGIRTPGVIRYVDRMTYLHESSPLETHSFGWPIKWRSPIFMPRWASRLTLRVTDVRVQRLHEISDEDAQAEGQGITWGSGCFSRSFDGAWDGINAKRATWASNPWVWAVSFEVPALDATSIRSAANSTANSAPLATVPGKGAK